MLSYGRHGRDGGSGILGCWEMKKNNGNKVNLVGLKFPVVVIGASAGGLDALTRFFKATPDKTGCAFVVVTHHRTDGPSLLRDILAEHTDMQVIEASNGTKIEPNRIYTLPPAAPFVSLNADEFSLLDESEARKLSVTLPGNVISSQLFHPLDYAFRQMAFALKDDAVGVILSGSGTDGTLGLKAIKEVNGLVMAQDPASAQFSGMPASAIATDMVDFVTTPEELPRKLLEYLNTQAKLKTLPGTTVNLIPTWALREIYVLLRARTGHDFSQYKGSTLQRRIERRMGLNHITSPADYIQYLHENDVEVDLLFKDLLIRVTSFFRDPDLWLECEKKIFPALVSERNNNESLRVWVPGCATGEEAYTIAILLTDVIQRLNKQMDIKIFATDLDLNAIELARKGEFPLGIAADVPVDFLNRYFTKKQNSYVIRKDIREMMVFAPQNVIKDPPFTKIDLISCRNLLIYMSSELQHQLLTLFVYALQDRGLMILGPSETPGESATLFDILSKSWKVYRKKPYAYNKKLPELDFGKPPPQATALQPITATLSLRNSGNSFSTHVVKLLAQRFAPASVITNECGDIYYIHGKTGAYLEPVEGRPRNNILEMARNGLNMAVSLLLRQVITQECNSAQKLLKAHSQGTEKSILIEVERIQSPEALRGLYLFSFVAQDDASSLPVQAGGIVTHSSPGEASDQVHQLENELQLARESYQTMVEELETTNEELKSTNEELQSTNEELQSTNEELETSREEMQSLYEELTTVNSELQSKIEDLSHTNDDLQNLMNSTRIAIIFLDNHLRIKRFTEPAKQLIALRESDLGRPLGELASNLVYDSLIEDAREVLSTLKENHTELKTQNGDWYQMRILPYRTVENMIDGLSLCFIDISKVKQAQQFADYLGQVIDSLPLPLLVLDSSLVVKLANFAFYDFFQLPANQVESVSIRDLSGGVWDMPELLTVLNEGFQRDFKTAQMTVDIRFPKIGTWRLQLRIGSLTPVSGGREKEFVTLTMMPGTDESPIH